MRRNIKKIIYNIRIKKMKKRGLKLGKNSVFMGKPNLGSEPYLVTIENNVTVSSNVHFITHDGGTRVFRSSEKYKDVIKYGKIVIKDNCFIGLNTIILPNVKIGPNSVVGAGSVVTKDIPPNSVYTGNPAKFIMSVDHYAEKSLMNTPVYDKEEYKKDKKKVLMELL